MGKIIEMATGKLKESTTLDSASLKSRASRGCPMIQDSRCSESFSFSVARQKVLECGRSIGAAVKKFMKSGAAREFGFAR